jgi:hypothetical protein
MGVREHFLGIKRSSIAKGEVVEFLNPEWIKYHFHEKFVAAVMAYSFTSDKFVDVPVGSARDEDCDPPLRSNVPEVLCHYPQGDRDYCMSYSFASALWYLGFQQESELVRMQSHTLEAWDRNSQLAALREFLSGLALFKPHPIVWGKKSNRYLRFNILNDISPEPTLVIPWGGDASMHHAVTVVGHYIFDSTTKHALHLTQESLDWCCNTRLGYMRAYFAIRFPVVDDRRTTVLGDMLGEE